MLKAGQIKKKYGALTEPIETLEPEDLRFDDKHIQWFDENKDCLIYNELEKLSDDLCDELNRLCQENYERLAAICVI